MTSVFAQNHVTREIAVQRCLYVLLQGLQALCPDHHHNYLSCLDAERVEKDLGCAPCLFLSLTYQPNPRLYCRVGVKRHRIILRDNIKDITNSVCIPFHPSLPPYMPLCQAIRRLARRRGVKRLSGLIYGRPAVSPRFSWKMCARNN